MKGFFKQKKKLGVSKNPKSSSHAKPKQPATCGTNVVQPPALVAHGVFDLQDEHEYNNKEEVLRQFDMNMAYGPCLGVSRLERWNRAEALGLHPPKQVQNLLKAGVVNTECLWNGRV